MEAPKTPQLARVMATKDDAQKIGEFLEWLVDQGFAVCSWQEWEEEVDPGEGLKKWKTHRRGYMPTRKTIDALLHDYFGIDANAEEQERRELLAYVAGQQDSTQSPSEEG